MRPRIPKSQYPLCETCGTRVKGRDNRFCSPGCIPKAVRQSAGSKGRKDYAYRRRAILLRKYVDRLSGRVTREDIMDAMWEFGKACYHNGYRTGREGGSLELARERGAA